MASSCASPTSPDTSRPPPANSGPLRIRGCHASLSSSSTPPTSPQSAAFWVAALGYTLDRRAGVIDIDDPRRLNPVLVFQELDASETERRRQRNRIHFEVAVPSDLAQTRLAATVAAGGRLLDESEDRWRVADPEGNEMVIVSGA